MARRKTTVSRTKRKSKPRGVTLENAMDAVSPANGVAADDDVTTTAWESPETCCSCGKESKKVETLKCHDATRYECDDIHICTPCWNSMTVYQRVQLRISLYQAIMTHAVSDKVDDLAIAYNANSVHSRSTPVSRNLWDNADDPDTPRSGGDEVISAQEPESTEEAELAGVKRKGPFAPEGPLVKNWMHQGFGDKVTPAHQASNFGPEAAAEHYQNRRGPVE